ncbi:MAG: paraquat-inducible protein A [Bacteroidota bacterium]
MKRASAFILYLSSIVCFGLGLTYPIMASNTLFGLNREEVFLTSSIRYFYKEGDFFVGSILLFFTFIFPILKYLFLGIQLAKIKLPGTKLFTIGLDLINKWAMLDVFVVALVIINMKFDSVFIHTMLKPGTTFFAVSVLLLMICSYLIKLGLDQSKSLPFEPASA